MDANGNVSLAPNTPVGTYTLTYKICDKKYPSVCDIATVTATVLPIPTVVSTTEAQICEGQPATISAVPSAGQIRWYDVPTGGNLLFTGNSFQTPILTSNTTYYVEAVDNWRITKTRTPVNVTVQVTSAPVAPISQVFCESQNATVAFLTTSGTAIKWYSASTGGAPLNTNTLLNTATYYVSQTINNCESLTRTPVKVTIYETVVIPPANSIDLTTCDTMANGSDTNGFAEFNLRQYETQILNGKDATKFNFLYFSDATYNNQIVNPQSFTNTIRDQQTIYLKIENKLNRHCYTGLSFKLTVYALPVVEPQIALKQCDDDSDGVSDFNLDEANILLTTDSSLNINYFTSRLAAESNDSLELITNKTAYRTATNTIFARIENQNNCVRVSDVDLIVSATSIPSDYMLDYTTCDTGKSGSDTDGLSTFNFSSAVQSIASILPQGQDLIVTFYENITDALAEQNAIDPTNYQNTTTRTQLIVVRVDSKDNNECLGLDEHVRLTVNPLPEFDLQSEATLCLNIVPLTISATNTVENYTYQWLDSNENPLPNGNTISYNFTTAGTYKLKATKTDATSCSRIREITIKESNIATITSIDVQDDSENNKITIHVTGEGDYEFALDDLNGSYQNETTFEGVTAGLHTIYIRDKNGCGIVEKEVSVIGFPRFFTPNGDGFNDTWQVAGVSFQPNSKIYIFNRYGKLLKQLNAKQNGWDGIYNGTPLPASDYWYLVELQDGRTRRGHFSLIRR